MASTILSPSIPPKDINRILDRFIKISPFVKIVERIKVIGILIKRFLLG